MIFWYNRLIPTNSDQTKYVLDEFFFVHYTSSTSSLYQFDELYHFMKKKTNAYRFTARARALNGCSHLIRPTFSIPSYCTLWLCTQLEEHQLRKCSFHQQQSNNWNGCVNTNMNFRNAIVTHKFAHTIKYVWLGITNNRRTKIISSKRKCIFIDENQPHLCIKSTRCY